MSERTDEASTRSSARKVCNLKRILQRVPCPVENRHGLHFVQRMERESLKKCPFLKDRA